MHLECKEQPDVVLQTVFSLTCCSAFLGVVKGVTLETFSQREDYFEKLLLILINVNNHLHRLLFTFCHFDTSLTGVWILVSTLFTAGRGVLWLTSG